MEFFIAIDRRSLPSFSPEKLESLTPRIMQWSDDIWILDVGLCLGYWWNRALQEEVDVVTLWRLVLQRLFGGDALTYSATVARHPWHALLLLGHMRDRELSGLIDYDSPFGRRHFQEVSWRAWWGAAKSVIPHFAAIGRKRLGSFSRSLGQMRRAVKRLKLERPHALKTAEPAAIRRRYGSVLGELWEWTYGGDAEEGALAKRPAFPWRQYQFRQPPSIKRNLDFSMNDWDLMAPLLQEDLNTLCGRESFDRKEFVLRILWRLHRTDGSFEDLDLSFRNPHSLHQDMPEQRTALAQALFRFSSLQTGEEREKSDVVIGVVAWEVIVTEKMSLPPYARSLFDDPTGDMQELAALENLLPMPLERLDVRPDWLPESSYGSVTDIPEVRAGATRANKPGGNDMREDRRGLGFQMAAAERPLFIFETPEAMLPRGRSRGLQFLERTMEKWWLQGRSPTLTALAGDDRRSGASFAGDDGRSGASFAGDDGRSSAVSAADDEKAMTAPSRDYYQLFDADGKSLWVFQNRRKQWFVHGIYG